MKLNDAQIQYINFMKGAYLILAGAGVGKTAVITQRFIKLSHDNNTILCVTFSNKAANEIIHRVGNVNTSWIGTFHAMAFKLLIIYEKINKNTLIIDEIDRRRILTQLGLTDYVDIYSKKTPQHIYNIYRSYCDEHMLMDFDYILISFYNILKNDENFRLCIKNKFDYIMVDEYQDTSILQQDILKFIIDNNIFCVGDENQTIYTWRNANIDNILSFKNHFENAQIYSLLYNYRCDANIINLANHVIKYNKQRYEKEIIPIKEAVIKPYLVCMMKQTIGQYIRSLMQFNGTKAVLVRTSMLLQQVENELIKYGIMYEIVNGQGITNKKEFRIIIAYLRVLIYNDLSSLDIFCSYPKRNLGPKAIENIRNNYINNIMETLQNTYLKEYHRLQVWYEATTLKEQWSALLQLIEYDESNIIIEQIRNYIFQYSNINEFINSIAFNNYENNFESHNKIYLMTVHASKGLEFDTVILPFLVEGCFPCKSSIINNSIEEERRLMYVAITRAKTNLYLMYNLQDCPRNSFGISRFIANVPSILINKQIY